MVFDKTKAMRNAERYLAQGKIQSAIAEYKQVVANDPKDFGTLNTLGDMHTKNADPSQAVRCYTLVAEHYSKQGFAQKAIAIYNKITKIQPNAIEVITKLAELYKQKGSINEARTHYQDVAEHYEREGKKLDALEIRKQIASLDPKDTSICLTLADAYLAEGQHDDAADAYTEAGIRLAKKSIHLEAIDAFEKALDVRPNDPKILGPFVQSHFACGTAGEAAARLSQIAADNPHDTDTLHLLIDCQLEAGNTAEAERTVISVVEKEPASYPKLLDLAKIYLKSSDAESAARAMAMSSEHLLLAGDVGDFEVLLGELLTLDPEQIEGLRLRARLSSWQRDEPGMHDALVRLAKVAKESDSLDDERFALSQLVMIAPHQLEYGDRLREINEQHGFDDTNSDVNLFDEQFMKAAKETAEPELETFADVTADASLDEIAEDVASADFAIVGTPIEAEISAAPAETNADDPRQRLLREVDSIRFYIDSGYLELAAKAIGELREEFGDSSEIADLVQHLKSMESAPEQDLEIVDPVTPAAPATNGTLAETTTDGTIAEPPKGFGIDELRNELGIDEGDPVDDSDYETHYHTAVAYQEMGLLDEAIREFQEAVGLVQPNDPARRFFQCANLLGHCFMQKSMPSLALTWFQRALETPGLGDEEKQGIWYEIASAYEADGDIENAGRYFEQVYTENINFRDVSERVRNMALSQ
jgi:tetratricopeptide (TPR) repeat protein